MSFSHASFVKPNLICFLQAHCIGLGGSHPKSSLIDIGQWLFSKNSKRKVWWLENQSRPLTLCAHNSFSMVTFSGWGGAGGRERGNRKMGKCGFRANPDRRGVFSNTKIYFETAEMYFQTTPPCHFTHQPGASQLYSWVYWYRPEAGKRRCNWELKLVREKGIGLLLTIQHLSQDSCYFCKQVSRDGFHGRYVVEMTTRRPWGLWDTVGTFRNTMIVAFVCLLCELCELLSVSLILYYY